jgi:hypothetical protein
MRTIRFALGSLLLVLFFASASMAQVQRRFVSGLGNDGNACNRTAPCRTFTQALLGTSPGGEVIVLDSAGYGSFTITQPVSVIAPPGVYAGISVFSGDGIDINATAGTDIVTLRGLTINNQGGSGTGIVFNSGGTLHIESCTVNGFSGGAGVSIVSLGNIFVKDTIARGNGYGISVSMLTTGTANIAMDRVHLDANAIGLTLGAGVAGAGVTGVLRNSSTSGNSVRGISLVGQGGPVTVDIESCMITGNLDGIILHGSGGGTGTASISNCTLARNTGFGYEVEPFGVLYSRGNNTITGNGMNTGTLQTLTAQ